MATTFEECPIEVRKIVDTLLAKKFGELKEAGVTFTLMFAVNKKKPALTQRGYPLAAKIKINSLADRVEGKADSTITICQESWEAKTEEQREALVAHEMYHLVVAWTKEKRATRRRPSRPSEMKRDDIGRPVLKNRTHDHEMGGFTTIVEWYGKDAPEAQALNSAAKAWLPGKLWKDWR